MSLIFKLANRAVSEGGGFAISMRCPACRRLVMLDSLGRGEDKIIHVTGDVQGSLLIGFRVSPSEDCSALLMVAYYPVGKDGLVTPKVVVAYPPERIDFDASNIPESIVKTLEEAITCHAVGCYIASAVMVRKTLEELCRSQHAKGKTLADQIKDLRTKVVVPAELLSGIDALRLLGNDAAHIELKNFDKVEKEEVEIGIEVTKELLKAVYQYSLLVSRLEALKKKPSTTV